jgi:archaellum component FlaC
MTQEQKLAAYTGILEGIEAKIDTINDMMEKLITESENLRKLYDTVSDEILAVLMSSVSVSDCTRS